MSDLRIQCRELPEGISVLTLEGVLDSRSTKELEGQMRSLIDEGKLKVAGH